jgi:signal peptidase II
MAEAVAQGRPASAAVRSNRTMGLALAAFVFLLDQGVKWLVTGPLHLQARGIAGLDLLPIFQLQWVPNYGISMSFLTAGSQTERWALVALTAAIAAFVLAWLLREKRRDDTIALALVLGGACGNILDRVRLGYVVDYANLHFGEISPFLVFNVGDAAITIGVLLLLVRALLTREPKAPRKEV